MDGISAEVYGDLDKDSIKSYNRRMRKAKYQAFWIRVRIWIRGRTIKIAALLMSIATVTLWSVYKTL